MSIFEDDYEMDWPEMTEEEQDQIAYESIMHQRISEHNAQQIEAQFTVPVDGLSVQGVLVNLSHTDFYDYYGEWESIDGASLWGLLRSSVSASFKIINTDPILMIVDHSHLSGAFGVYHPRDSRDYFKISYSEYNRFLDEYCGPSTKKYRQLKKKIINWRYEGF